MSHYLLWPHEDLQEFIDDVRRSLELYDIIIDGIVNDLLQITDLAQRELIVDSVRVCLKNLQSNFTCKLLEIDKERFLPDFLPENFEYLLSFLYTILERSIEELEDIPDPYYRWKCVAEVSKKLLNLVENFESKFTEKIPSTLHFDPQSNFPGLLFILEA